MLTFVCPPGIGDISWIISKIYHLFDKREVGIKISDAPPPRSSEFIDLLPVKNLGYTPWKFPEGSIPILTDLDSLDDGEYRIQCNTPLERGIRLADIFPHQPTNYHYPIATTKAHKKTASDFIGKIEGNPKIGIYASAYRGFCPWHIEHWVQFASMLRKHFPDAAFYVIGAQYDDRSLDVFRTMKQQGFNVVSQVGEHHIGATLEVIKQLDYFFAYPSGLGILADVVQTPCMMWLYDGAYAKGLINSYKDPAGKGHINLPTTSPEKSFGIFLDSL